VVEIYNPDHQIIIEFHQLLQNKLYLSSLQSCNSKKELDFYIKPKNNLIALHDKFIKYGTKRATSFIIIDIDGVDATLEEYEKEIKYKLNGYEPSWITKTDKGFHIGFILENPLWLNNNTEKRRVEEIKKDLTILLNGDIAGSHRLIGYWRNPLTHQSILNLKLHNIEELEKMATSQYFESFSLFDNEITNNEKYVNKAKNKKQISKSNWEQIDKTGFSTGNRNNFLFNKIIGMLYNGIITNDEVITTLESINNKELENKEIQKIAKSILKYNIKPSTSEKTKDKRVKGIYYQELWDNGIHNYTENNKVQFERQKFGQLVTTILKNEKTLKKLLDGYLELYKTHQVFTNNNIAKSSNVSKRTVQRYRNEKNIEENVKNTAFRKYMQSLAQKGVMANGTPLVDLLNVLLEKISFCYKRDGRVFKFVRNCSYSLDFYDTGESFESLAA
jgi:hypothetical protein